MKEKLLDSIRFGFGFYIGFNLARKIRKMIFKGNE